MDQAMQQALQYHSERFFDFLIFITDKSKNSNKDTIATYINGWKTKLTALEVTWNAFFKASLDALITLVRGSLGIIAAVGKSLLPSFHTNEFQVCTNLYIQYYWG